MKSRLAVAIGLLICANSVLASFDGSQAVAAVSIDAVKVEYRIHQTPSDPQSPVVFTIQMTLERQSTSSSQASWHAAVIEFRKKGTGGAADRVWVAYDVEADTTDGLWRVTHADVDQPVAAEFVLPPAYWGTADAVISTNPDLDFDFQGRPYTPPAGGAPYAVTAGMDWELDTAVGPEIPPGHDDPVDVPPVVHPPGGTS